ncbi:CPBP family intramembrane glutamic endopeptidase [uncultured Imperialibacter sp.]|uniref:CPBP family intramembrane glutamic endopeptidase n=1 Tax=uncultured Imperialibacter sp. TaxID=1672639 RepID=UPI0030DAEA51|tara:strand:- start:4667 stop:5473 length:807 start_codon:yes stop_codon:yes gene_type:complete
MEETTQTYYPTLKQSFGLIGLLLLFSLAGAIPMIIIKGMHLNNGVYEQVAQLAMYVISFALVIELAWKNIRKQGLWDPTPKRQMVGMEIIAVLVIMTIATIIIVDPIIELIPMPEYFKRLFEELMKPDLTSFLTLVVAAPILEELLFRGIILEGLLKNYSPPKAIIWSALIFGIAHFNPWQAIGATATGVLIGWAYVRTNSLIPGIIIHFFNNLFAFALMAFISGDVEDMTLPNLIGNNAVYLAILAIALATLVVGYRFIERWSEIKS